MKRSTKRAFSSQLTVYRACAELLENRRLLSWPGVLSSAFDFETAPHKLTVRFDQDVSAT